MVKNRLAELQAQSKYVPTVADTVGSPNVLSPSSLTIDSRRQSETLSSQKTGGSDADEMRPLHKKSVFAKNFEIKVRQKLTAASQRVGGGQVGKDQPPINLTEMQNADINGCQSSPERQLAVFMNRYANVATDIDRISENVKHIDRLYKKVLNSTYRVEADEAEIERLSEHNKRLSQSIQRTLKEDQRALSQELTLPASQDRARIEMRMKETQIAAQSRRFYATWNEYNRVKLDFRERSRRMLIQRSRITNAELTEDQIEDMLDNGQLMKMFGADHMEQERIAKAQLDELQTRHDQFIKLEASIREVRDMFVDIAMLVEGQGEMINSIERHVCHAADAVARGRVDLDKAVKSQAGARKRKCILITVVCGVLLLVLLVLLIDFGWL